MNNYFYFGLLLRLCAETTGQRQYPATGYNRLSNYNVVSPKTTIPKTRNVVIDADYVLKPSTTEVILDDVRVELFQKEPRGNLAEYYYVPLFMPLFNSSKITYNRFARNYSITLFVQVWSKELETAILKALGESLFPGTVTRQQLKMFPIRHLSFAATNGDNDISVMPHWIDYANKPKTIFFSIPCQDDESCQALFRDLKESPEVLGQSVTVMIALTEEPVKDLQRPLETSLATLSGSQKGEVEALANVTATLIGRLANVNWAAENGTQIADGLAALKRQLNNQTDEVSTLVRLNGRHLGQQDALAP